MEAITNYLRSNLQKNDLFRLEIQIQNICEKN